MSDLSWIDTALVAARPQAVGALLRYFRDLDAAEEAFQEACLRALSKWPEQGPPRDPVSWLIFVGKNAQLDGLRRRAKQQPLPPEAQLSELGDAEAAIAEQLDDAHYRDDVLRLLFVCCHPELPATQQLALALRIVCGLSVPQIARAFLVGEAALEQRITRAKARIADAGVAFEVPDAAERTTRVAAVAAVVYLLFNEGYSATGPDAPARAPLCDEAIRLGRLLLRLFPAEPELRGLLALMLLQHARAPARLDGDGAVILLDAQDRTRWRQPQIAEGSALVDPAHPGPYQLQAAIAAVHARAAHADATDWAAIDALYAQLEAVQPSPVVTLNRAVIVMKVRGAAAALALVEPLAKPLGAYFYFHGLRGTLLAKLGRTAEARAAYTRAIALAQHPVEAAQIRAQLDALDN
jgi:RNA polymerase sigma-70 factor (ECF subfamily)